MIAVDDPIDVQCPQCTNDTVYLEKIEALPTSIHPSYLCRCGKCGWRFRMYLPELELVDDALPAG
jgi:hypothetical protein